MTIRQVWGIVLIVLGVFLVISGLSDLSEISQISEVSSRFLGSQRLSSYFQQFMIPVFFRVVVGLGLCLWGSFLYKTPAVVEQNHDFEFDNSTDRRDGWKF